MIDTGKLKTFAQEARAKLLSLVRAKMDYILKLEPKAYSGDFRAKAEQINELISDVKTRGQETVIDEIAYIWFNRFTALRFMDANGYSNVRVISPLPGHTQPELLEDFKKGNSNDLKVDSAKLFEILDGRIPSNNPENEVYGHLLIALCNSWHKSMPFLFEKVQDYTELLMPEDLLSERSIIHDINESITDEMCSDVEILGWLYQHYISERKDEVMASKKKVQPRDIPAVTQLFTPHWIVRYMVENSLGRLWLDNRPNSKLKDHMDYYIESDRPEGYEPLRVSSPEDIRLLDPACGSGHILTYSFDLLTKIYEEEGYDTKDIPNLILTKNLYGIEIDERASEYASFALAMKARGYYRRFFRRNTVSPNILRLEKVTFDEGELDDYSKALGEDLISKELKDCLAQFDKVDSVGSLIRPEVSSVGELIERLTSIDMSDKLFVAKTHEKVLRALRQIEYLAGSYYCVVANPPYMGTKGMNDELKSFAKKNYPDSKSDTFAMFIERGFDFLLDGGFNAMVTMQSWMFLSSYEKLRAKLLDERTIISMAHIGAGGVDSINGEVVQTTSFVINKSHDADYRGTFLRLVDGKNEAEKESHFLECLESDGTLYHANSSDFKKIPGSPVAYWVSDAFRRIFSITKPICSIADTAVGLFTCDNDKFIRLWSEVSLKKICFNASSALEAETKQGKYFPYNKGGGFRKWYGLSFLLVQFDNNGIDIRNYRKQVGQSFSLPGEKYYFKEGITWSGLTSSVNSFRYCGPGFIFESNKGQMLFSDDHCLMISILNSKVAKLILSIINPTISLQSSEIKKMPLLESSNPSFLGDNSRILIKTHKSNWDSYETSWDFKSLPLLSQDEKYRKVSEAYDNIRSNWRENTLEMQRLEEENNRIFIEAYGLEDELTPDVPLKEITLTCNPYYRYNSNKTDEEYEALLRSDTMKEFISYSVGCMFGRYSLDRPGLVLANQGETLQDYIEKVGRSQDELSFIPDDDNVLPIVDGEYFEDDIVERFKKFLKVTFGEENYQENLSYIEESIGKDLRAYFLRDFYAEHVRRYKKRPIYWLFSSPKKSFNALIYMHRYTQDTINVVLNDYLRPYISKLNIRQENLNRLTQSESIKASDRTKAQKEIDKIKKILQELKDYEREVYDIAIQRINIDLDDGVKVNYAKFGKILRKI